MICLCLRQTKYDPQNRISMLVDCVETKAGRVSGRAAPPSISQATQFAEGFHPETLMQFRFKLAVGC